MRADPVILGREQHRLSRHAIDSDALKVLYRLHNHGFKAYLVGGAVRDLLLGRLPKDFDVVTDARPGEIKKLFKNAFLIGRRFRLAHIRFRGGKIIEVATFRREADEDGSGDIHNTFGTAAEDAFRRDITINALFYDIATFSIIDYVGGLQDLRRGVVRVIGEPSKRFQEDPIRILRVLRHAARLNFSIQDATAHAVYPAKELIETCSGARMYEEFAKDMNSGYLRPVVTLMDLYGILSHIFGAIGIFMAQNPSSMAKVMDCLALIDERILAGQTFKPENILAVLFFPWADHVLHHAAEKSDRGKIIHDAFMESGVQAMVPKTVRTNCMQILMIIEAMHIAMQTGRFPWSIKKRALYKDAAWIFALLFNRNLLQEDDPFPVAFSQKYPQMIRSKKRRRRSARGAKIRPSP
ncbi:MAG: polynucleotide adenylyltransferase PcnB [Syntrophaceae bacterium]